jgi:hypothetical protein
MSDTRLLSEVGADGHLDQFCRECCGVHGDL